MKAILLPATRHSNSYASEKSQRLSYSLMVEKLKYKFFTGTGCRFPEMLKLLILIFLLNIGYSQLSSAVIGPGPDWSFCRRITLSPVTTSSDFQVRILLSSGQYTGMNAAGNDLRFYDVNENSCNYWIETWNTSGNSTIWVKVPVSGTNYLYMYYGNGSAPAASNGANVFDFFDDFTSLGSQWSRITSGGSITQSGSNVTLSNTNGATVGLSNISAFTPSSTSFFLETKHREVGYNRNRYYATTSSQGGSPLAFDYGYFYEGTGARTSAQVFWNGYPGSNSVTNNTDYLTRWQITDGSTYNWYTLNYSTGAAVSNGSRTTTYGSNIRFITISVTEVSNTSTIVDWIRIRKYAASEPLATIGGQVTNLSVSITAQTNVLCYGLPTGSATVTATGGSGGYTYLWNTTPAQSGQVATNLSGGTYTVTVTENSIGLSGTATVTITESTVVRAIVTNQTNITCFAANDGTITVSASGGLGPYTFSVDNGGTWLPPTGTDLCLFTGLLPNHAYRIKVKDVNGCISR